jgi:hypothetical protein
MRSELRRTSSMLVLMKSVLIGRELNKIPKTLQVNFKELNNHKKPDLTMSVLSKEINSISLQRT